MNPKFIIQSFTNLEDDNKNLSTDIQLYSNSQNNNKTIFPNSTIIKIDSYEVDKLLGKTQDSLEELVTTISNEDNIKEKSTKKIPNKKNFNNNIKTKNNLGNYYYLKLENKKTDKNNCKNINPKNISISDYNKGINNILENQKKLLSNNYDDKNEEKKPYDNKLLNKNNILKKKTEKNFNQINNNELINRIANNSYYKLKCNTNSNNNNISITPIPSCKNAISVRVKNTGIGNTYIDEINKYKKIIESLKNNNKILIKENEDFMKKIKLLNDYKKLNDYLNKENICLKQKLQKNGNTNLSISQEFFSVLGKKSNKNKEIISSLKKEIKNLNEQLNKYKNKENNYLPIEHDINTDELEEMKNRKKNLEEQNIFLITELNNIKKNQTFIENNNFLEKKNKNLKNQIINLKERIKTYNNLQIYIKLYLQNKNFVNDEKEKFLIRKIQEELGSIQEKNNNIRGSFQPNINYFLDLDDNINNLGTNE